MSTEDRLKEIFDDVLEVGDVIQADMQRDQYENWDSLANVTMFMAISEEFGDIIALEDMEEADSFSKILSLIQSKM